MRASFKVTTKAAIYSKDLTKVLVIDTSAHNQNTPRNIATDKYGLPGGHIENGETPDLAMARELYEECGIETIDLKKVDFFTHSNGKIVLAYTGIMDPMVEVESKQADNEGNPLWLSKQEFEVVVIEVNYRKLVLENWPTYVD